MSDKPKAKRSEKVPGEDPRGRRPLAETIAERLQQSIELGQWIPGGKMPSSRTIAKRYAVSINTAQAAIQILAARGLLILRPRRQPIIAHRGQTAYKPSTTDPGERCIAAVFSLSAEVSWAMPILQGADGPIRSEGLNVELFAYRLDGSDIAEDVAARLSRLGDRLAGVMIFAEPPIHGLVPILDQRRIPWVSLNQLSDLMTSNYVAADNFGSGWLVGRCFAKLGYERVGMLSFSPHESLTAAEKFRGFVQGFMEDGDPRRRPALLACKGTSEEEGYRQTMDYFENVGLLDGVFTFGDYLAQGAVHACRRIGHRVPEHMGVVGGTGLRAAARFDPPHTVTTQPMRDLGKNAAIMLLRMLHTGRFSMPGQRIPCRIVVRESLPLNASMYDWLQAEQDQRVEAIQRWQWPLPDAPTAT